MSTAVSATGSSQPFGQDQPAADNGAQESRGNTYVEAKVVERIAAQAVREVSNATGSARRILGVSMGTTDEDTGANVHARVDGTVAIVETTMTVIYPASVQAVTQQTREHIRGRVQGLTGLQVKEVNITVADMHVRRPETPRVR